MSCWYRANAAERRWSVRRDTARLRPRHVRAALRLHLHAIADGDEQRHLDRRAGLERRGLVPAAGGGVAAHARLGLGDLELDGGRELDAGRLVVDEQQVDVVVGLEPAQRV